MNIVVVDTNVASILLNPKQALWAECLQAVIGQHLAIAFMTRAELLLWPAVNNWGLARRAELVKHLTQYTTLHPDEETCEFWVRVKDGCRRKGRPIQTADVWIAATALQWDIPLITADYGDFAAVDGLEIVPIGGADRR